MVKSSAADMKLAESRHLLNLRRLGRVSIIFEAHSVHSDANISLLSFLK